MTKLGLPRITPSAPAWRPDRHPIRARYHPRRRTAWFAVAGASLAGFASFIFPFLLPVVHRAESTQARAGEAPLILAAVTGLCLAAILAELSGDQTAAHSTKTIALLGVLVAVNATLRLVPTFLGMSPVFLLIILTGASFGASIGFQMGALTLLVSAFLTGGVGPWLPYQMLGAGWVGLTAGWLPRWAARPRTRLLVLATFGAVWGILYGALLNLSFWPFAAPGAEVRAGLAWVPGMSVVETVQTYTRFYLATSLAHDITRAVANAILILVLGGPILRLLDRYRSRFTWQPWTSDTS